MEKLKYHISVPDGLKITRNEFYMYDPSKEFTQELNLYYLQEDLLQIESSDIGITIDLGWYGDTTTNIGKFKIYIIKDFDWENPQQEIEAISSIEIYDKLIEVIKALA